MQREGEAFSNMQEELRGESEMCMQTTQVIAGLGDMVSRPTSTAGIVTYFLSGNFLIFPSSGSLFMQDSDLSKNTGKGKKNSMFLLLDLYFQAIRS